MKKLILLLLFIPLVSFGQGEIKVAVKSQTNIIVPEERSEAEINVKVPLSVNIDDYSHIAIVDVLLSNGNRTSGGFKRVINALEASPLTLINPTDNKKKYRKNSFYLRDLKNPKWLYLYYVAGYSGRNLTVSVTIKDSENNKVFETYTNNMPWRTILTQIASFSSQDQVVANSDSNKQNQSDSVRQNAIKELKELKNLFDLELITQEEFNKKSKELKKIILGN